MKLPTVDNLLHVGVSQSPITPPVGFKIAGPEFADRTSRGIDDDLMVRCVAFHSNGEMVVIASLDVWGVAESLLEAITRTVSKATGISSSNVLVTCTNNGVSSPVWRDPVDLPNEYVNYVAYLTEVVAGTALDAALSLEPAAIGTVTAAMPNLTCFADSPQSEELEVARETLVLTAAYDADDHIICLLYNFACPATIVGETQRWSADFPGIASGALEQAGVGSAIYIQGASSGIRPFDWYDGNRAISHPDRTWQDAQAFGVLLATQALSATSNIVTRRNASVRGITSENADLSALRLGDTVLVSSRQPQPVEFSVALRETTFGEKVLINANTVGAPTHPGLCLDTATLNAARRMMRQLEA